MKTSERSSWIHSELSFKGIFDDDVIQFPQVLVEDNFSDGVVMFEIKESFNPLRAEPSGLLAPLPGTVYRKYKSGEVVPVVAHYLPKIKLCRLPTRVELEIYEQYSDI